MRRDGDDSPQAPANAGTNDTLTRLTRRSFLRASGITLAAGALAFRGDSERDDEIAAEPVPEHVTPGEPLAPATPVVSQYPGAPHPEVPFAPPTIPAADLLRFFTPREARTVEAAAELLIPAGEDGPGAKEAGVLTFIDYALANGDGFNEPIYRLPPFAQGFEGDEPPKEGAQGVIWVPETELERYGFQSALTAREIFRVGIALLDRAAQDRHGGAFADLPLTEQEELLMDLEDGEVNGFCEPSGEEFFDFLHEFTLQGFFSDPQYGGNRDMAGWRLIDYPGAQRAYTPGDMAREGHAYQPQPMAQLDHVHPGQFANRHVLMPVFGSDMEHPPHHGEGGARWPYRPFEQPTEGD